MEALHGLEQEKGISADTLMDALEENDDVQDVYANFDIPETVLEAVAS